MLALFQRPHWLSKRLKSKYERFVSPSHGFQLVGCDFKMTSRLPGPQLFLTDDNLLLGYRCLTLPDSMVAPSLATSKLLRLIGRPFIAPCASILIKSD